MSLRAKRSNLSVMVCAVLLIVGTIYTFYNLDKSPDLLNIDEAAWIFDSYYSDLYFSGNWEDASWREFEKYAHHPPLAKYIYGAVLHLTGNPVKSIEPRRFWYEHDFDYILSRAGFLNEINSRMNYHQLIAIRSLSIVFAIFAAITIFLFTFRLTNLLGASVSYLLLIIHPYFKSISTLATPDSLLLFLLTLSIFIAYEVAIAFKNRSRWRYLLMVIFGSILGVSLSVKIVAVLWIVPAFVSFVVGFISPLPLSPTVSAELTAEALSHEGRGNNGMFIIWASILLISSTIFAFLIAYILDPAYHGSFFNTLLERFVWRARRVEVQQTVFFMESLPTIVDRIRFANLHTFFLNFPERLFFFFTLLGLLPLICRRGLNSCGYQNYFLIIILALFSYLLTIATLPMAWARYIIVNIPFIFILSGVGGVVLFSYITSFFGEGRGEGIFRYFVTGQRIRAWKYLCQSYPPPAKEGMGEVCSSSPLPSRERASAVSSAETVGERGKNKPPLAPPWQGEDLAVSEYADQLRYFPFYVVLLLLLSFLLPHYIFDGGRGYPIEPSQDKMRISNAFAETMVRPDKDIKRTCSLYCYIKDIEKDSLIAVLDEKLKDFNIRCECGE